MLNKLKDSYRCLFLNLSDKYNDIKLSFTGGVDSRTTFAFMQNAGIEFSTFSHYVPHIAKCDINVPKRISKMFGHKYQYIKKGRYDASKENFYDDFICKSIDDADKFVYANSMQYPDEKGTIIIKNGLYESVALKSYFADKFKLDMVTKEAFINRLVEMQPRIKGTPIIDSLEQYYDTLPCDLNNEKLGCYFYQQQRNGCWSSYTERGYDILNSDIIHVCNCLYISCLWVSFPDNMRIHTRECQRSDKKCQKWVIGKLYPELNKIEYNHKSFYIRIKQKVKIFLKKIIRKK